MQQTIIHVGLDVDDTRYHGSALNKNTGEVMDFQWRPTLKGLIAQLDKLARHLNPETSGERIYQFTGQNLVFVEKDKGTEDDLV